MATMWWKTLESFERDLKSANESRVETMRQWASDKEDDADLPGSGRNPKARRHFRMMRVAAEQERANRDQL
ncbi:hypothetical protein ACX80E_10665 [Arthrobacter sp. TMN-49]